MAENIRTRASTGDVHLIRSLGSGLEEPSSKQAVNKVHILRNGESGIGQGQAIGSLDIIPRSTTSSTETQGEKSSQFWHLNKRSFTSAGVTLSAGTSETKLRMGVRRAWYCPHHRSEFPHTDL